MITQYSNSQLKTKKLIASGKNIFITGNPGTGKTELLRDICEDYISQGKKVLVTASTGLAAANFEHGRTLHSALKFAPGMTVVDYDHCISELKNTDLLIVDEVSMLGFDIINHLAKCLKQLDNPPQLIFSGDFSQLPPVKCRKYPFENHYWKEFNLINCILTETVRQVDPEFIENLAKLRIGDPSCIEYFNRMSRDMIIEEAITICTKNIYVDEINNRAFDNLPGVPKIYSARDFLPDTNFDCTPFEKDLAVKLNMRVMATKNDPNEQYQNGSLGTVIGMADEYVTVRFDKGNVVDMYPVTHFLDSKHGKGTAAVKQIPLKLGYAITIHKSQGQTFDDVNIIAPDCWDAGQLYVALSRVRNIHNMHLSVPITPESLKTDQKVIEFYDELLNHCA